MGGNHGFNNLPAALREIALDGVPIAMRFGNQFLYIVCALSMVLPWSVAEILRAYVEDVKGVGPAAPVEAQPTTVPAQTKERSEAQAGLPVREVSRTGTLG